MKNLKSRVAVMAPDADRVVFFAPRWRAEAMLASGCAIGADGNAVRIVAGRHAIHIRPGSFGVHRQHVPVGSNQYGLSGGVVFSHCQTYERVAA